jgi:glycosyltransferase involved in cell wall biosynthesis
VLPAYRAGFFDRLARDCGGGLSLIAGKPRRSEAILTTDRLQTARYVSASNIHLLSGGFYLCFQRGLQKWLNEWDPDILILEANPRYLTNSMAMTWMRRRGRPVIGWGLGAPSVTGGAARFRDLLRRRYLKRFDALVAYSTRGAVEYRAQGANESRIFVAPNAVTPPPAPAPSRPAPVDRSVRLLSVGRLQARKRIDLLLRACRGLQPPPDVWIVGDGPERETLEELARRDFPEAHFTGALQGDALREQYLQADLFVLPGTGGLAVQEAMAFGLPVIVAEGDGTQEDLVQTENGWLVAPGDGEALRSALLQAVSDPQGLVARGRASHRLVVEKFNTDVMADVFVNAMLRVASREA